jgi:non-ribosomal peptide synthetase component F
MANAMNYSSEILSNVSEVIWNIKERGGLASSKFLNAELERLQGQYAAVVVNVALMAIGKPKAVEDPRFPLTDAQYNVLVERAKQNSRVELAQIAELRAAKGK